MGINPGPDLQAFDVSLELGGTWERWLDKIFSQGDTVEVKAELDTWVTTGNMAIEYRCSGNPSGLSTTRADYWAHLFIRRERLVFMLLTEVFRLRAIVRKLWSSSRKVQGVGDGNADIVLLNIQEVCTLLGYPGGVAGYLKAEEL